MKIIAHDLWDTTSGFRTDGMRRVEKEACVWVGRKRINPDRGSGRMVGKLVGGLVGMRVEQTKWR